MCIRTQKLRLDRPTRKHFHWYLIDLFQYNFSCSLSLSRSMTPLKMNWFVLRKKKSIFYWTKEYEREYTYVYPHKIMDIHKTHIHTHTIGSKENHQWSMMGRKLMAPKIDVLGHSRIYICFFAQLNTHWFMSECPQKCLLYPFSFHTSHQKCTYSIKVGWLFLLFFQFFPTNNNFKIEKDIWRCGWCVVAESH